MSDRTVKDVDKEMTYLYPRKERAYSDYMDDRSDTVTAGRVWAEFCKLRHQWNALVEERKRLIEEA